MIDMHCHLDFGNKGMTIAQYGGLDGARFLSMTVTPKSFVYNSAAFKELNNVAVAAGLHPRWIAGDECGQEDVDLLCQLVEYIPLIGEVGLDFSAPYEGTEELQISAFRQIIQACSAKGDRLISIHALKATGQVLDILEEFNACESCQCILHWFSGSSQELWRAMGMGCWFSVNNRMLATGKGREYCKVIPSKRLLLESDLPANPKDACDYGMLKASHNECLRILKEVRNQNCEELLEDNSYEIFKCIGLVQ